jgi:glutamate-ammonia-ligase adenylyltransferase
MTRARCVLGSGSDQWPQRFDAVREAVITSDRDTVALRREIALMRERVGAAHPVRGGRFDVKHSHGGMVDAEFAVQYLVLSHSAAHSALRNNVGNIALLARAETAGLLPPGTSLAAGNAYRELRRLQHQARLDEAPTQVEPGSVAVHSAAIQALWAQVMGADQHPLIPSRPHTPA